MTNIILFDDLKAKPEADLTGLRPNIDPVPGFEVTGGERKFIVLKGKEEIYVIIGPALCKGSYCHEDILKRLEKNVPDARISGGGKISFRLRPGMGWFAKFHDSSGDFGVFDPCILDVAVINDIRKRLNMPVIFEWIYEKR